jgi:DNA-binding transcriptional LysR family regulator
VLEFRGHDHRGRHTRLLEAHRVVDAARRARPAVADRGDRDVIRVYRRDHPDVRLELVEEGNAGQISQLLEDRLDVGFLRGPVDEPALAIDALIDDPLLACVPDDHPLAGATSVDPASLAAQPLVLWARSAAPTTYADVVELFRRHGVQPPVVDEATRIQTVLSLVAAGVGIALLPASFANLGRRGVRFVRLRPPVPHRPLVLAWRAGDPSPTLATFLAAARRVAPGYAEELQTLSSPHR